MQYIQSEDVWRSIDDNGSCNALEDYNTSTVGQRLKKTKSSEYNTQRRDRKKLARKDREMQQRRTSDDVVVTMPSDFENPQMIYEYNKSTWRRVEEIQQGFSRGPRSRVTRDGECEKEEKRQKRLGIQKQAIFHEEHVSNSPWDFDSSTQSTTLDIDVHDGLLIEKSFVNLSVENSMPDNIFSYSGNVQDVCTPPECTPHKAKKGPGLKKFMKRIFKHKK